MGSPGRTDLRSSAVPGAIGGASAASSMPPLRLPTKAPTPRRYRLHCMPTNFASAQLALDLVGVFVFALSGGLVAVKKRFDLFGVLGLACAAGLGGGIMRDVLIGDIPPVGISDWRLLTAAALGRPRDLLLPSRHRADRPFRRVLDAGLAVRRRRQPQGRDDARRVPDRRGPRRRDLGRRRRRGPRPAAGQVPEVLRRELYAIPPSSLPSSSRAAGLPANVDAVGRGGARLRRPARRRALDLNALRPCGPGRRPDLTSTPDRTHAKVRLCRTPSTRTTPSSC